MADKKISDLTAASTVTSGDLFLVETSGGNSRKIDAKAIGAGSGSSFPGSPSSGDRFYRTDRNIEYFYDGTRWLSTQLFVLHVATPDALNPVTATTTWRAANPWWNVYDIYVETGKVAQYAQSSSASNYFTYQFNKFSSSQTAIGSSISSQNDTINQMIGHSVTINAVVASTYPELDMSATETGTANSYIVASLTYRLVG